MHPYGSYNSFKSIMIEIKEKLINSSKTTGFFHMICKLLFYDIRPVFVFDSTMPEMKLGEIRAGQPRREKLQSFVSRNDTDGMKRLTNRLLDQNLKRQKELDVTPKFNTEKSGKRGSTSAKSNTNTNKKPNFSNE